MSLVLRAVAGTHGLIPPRIKFIVFPIVYLSSSSEQDSLPDDRLVVRCREIAIVRITILVNPIRDNAQLHT